jgi:hypothetical protein
MLQVDISTNYADFYIDALTLPAMDLLSSTTARFFKPALHFLDSGFVIGVSFVGSLSMHNKGGTDSEILLSTAF